MATIKCEVASYGTLGINPHGTLGMHGFILHTNEYIELCTSCYSAMIIILIAWRLILRYRDIVHSQKF